MLISRLILSAAIPVLFFHGLSSPAFAQEEVTANSVLNQYADSIGGIEVINAVKTISITARLSNDSRNEDAVPTVTQKQANGKFLLIIDVPEFGQILRGSNGEVSWTIDPQRGPRIVEGQEKIDLTRQFSAIFPVTEWMGGFDGSITYKGMEKIEGRMCHKVLFQGRNKQPPIARFFERDSGRLIKIEASSQSPQGLVTVDTYASDFRETDGVTLPFEHLTFSATGNSKIAVQEVNINPEFAEGTFDLPAEIQKLVDESVAAEDEEGDDK